jgi:hypothetical protein
MTFAAVLTAAAARIRARQGEPEIAHPVTLPPPMPQFADLDRLARYQATRRAFQPSADAARIGARLALECGGDMDAVRAKVAAFAAAIERVAQAECRRDLAQAYREAGE